MINTMQLFKVQGNRGLSLRLATATAGLLMLAACASVPQPPTADLQAAELASARAEAARAEVVNDEMRKSIDTLKQEMQRNTGDKQ